MRTVDVEEGSGGWGGFEGADWSWVRALAVADGSCVIRVRKVPEVSGLCGEGGAGFDASSCDA